MNNKFKVINKSTMRVDSVPDWGHSSEISFEGTDPEKFEVDTRILEKVLSFNQDKIFNQSKLAGSRHGSLLSVTDKSRWTLDLIGKAHEGIFGTKLSPPKVIEAFVNFFTNPMFSKYSFQLQVTEEEKLAQRNVIYPIRFLMLPFYSFSEYDIKDDNEEVIEIDKTNEIAELFIPDITFHPISLVRNIFLCIIKKSYVDFQNPLTRDEIELICDANGERILVEEMLDDELANTEIDITKTIENCMLKLEQSKRLIGGIASLERDAILDVEQKKDGALYNSEDNKKREGGWGSPKPRIAISRARQFINRNGLIEQLSESHIQEIKNHLELLCDIKSKCGNVLSYSQSNLDFAKKAFAKESQGYSSVFDSNSPDIE
jgi:hypothetical protein